LATAIHAVSSVAQVHLNSTVIRRMESHLRVAFLLQLEG
jgi:hypothetical protein